MTASRSPKLSPAPKSRLWEILSPVAARMPRVVREFEVLRISASLFGENPTQNADTARREVLRWAQNRSGGQLPHEAWDFQDFEYLSGGRNSTGIRLQNENSDIWAIRADDPDKNIPGRIWTTEVTVGLMVGQPPRFSARLLASTHENELDIEPHTPGLVQQVAEKCSLSRGPQQITAEPWLIESESDAAQLADLLVDPYRKLLAFVLSVPEDSSTQHKPLIDAEVLARATLGNGFVVILPAANTWTLTERFGKQRSVFGGAARTYLPGFATDSNPYAHRLVLADHLATVDGAAQCMRWMRSLAATESIRRILLGRDVLAFAGIRDASLKVRQQQLKKEGASDAEQLQAASARIEALEREVFDQKASLEYFDTEHKREEERADTAEEQLRAAAFRIQQLIQKIRESGTSVDSDIQPPKSWAEFGNWCDVNLAGRLVLSPLARNQIRSPKFEDVETAARCLLWLATGCRDRRIHGGEGSLRDEPVEDGIRNAHCGADQFDLDWQGQRQTADWHIKNGGNTRDPRRCLRIYYFWHPDTQQIVVAEMPAHRRTDAT
jgi:hypothetical protein